MIVESIAVESTASPTDGGVATCDVVVLDRADDAWERYERQLAEIAPLPFGYRSSVARSSIVPPARMIVALDRTGRCCGAVAIEMLPVRQFPGHLVVRARRVGATVPANARETLCSALADFVNSNRRILRMNVELFSRDAIEREQLGQELSRYGFNVVLEQSCYSHTVVLDIQPDEEHLFAGLGPSTRRNIRAVTKNRVVVRAVTDSGLAGRIDELEREALARSGGRHVPQDWSARIGFSAEHPDLSRVVGLFRTDAVGPEALLAFAWAIHHGSHAEYSSGACTRRTPLNLPMAYGLIWDLIVWARRSGAEWFDLGGVTSGRLGDEGDRLGGISDFKRSFSKTVVRIGEEYELRAPTIRSRAGHWIQRALRGGA